MSTAIRPYLVGNADGRSLYVVARSETEAVRHASEKGWSARVASALELARDAGAATIEYAKPEYRPLPAGTPTADDLRMPGEQS